MQLYDFHTQLGKQMGSLFLLLMLDCDTVGVVPICLLFTTTRGESVLTQDGCVNFVNLTSGTVEHLSFSCDINLRGAVPRRLCADFNKNCTDLH